MTICFGLDLSLISPGVAIYDTTTGTWSMFGFAQRIREKDIKKRHQGTTIVMLPSIPNSPTTTNEERYEHIRHHIIDVIMDPYIHETDVIVGIECYAFGANNSGNSYKLQELGGVLKHGIWKTYPQWRQQIIPPTQWKKKTVGNGRATKAEVVEYVRSHGPCAPLMSLLGLVPAKNGDIPCPVQDLADAACICLSTTIPNTVTSKKRRMSV
jgi:Holliday junction resolvasome RuvABC endonuclease subunit